MTPFPVNIQSSGEITYETKDPAFCYAIVSRPEDVVSLSTDLTKWLSQVESCKVIDRADPHFIILLGVFF